MPDDARDDVDAGRDAAEEEREAELERARKLILERRNRFMAAALAGLGMTAGNACTRASICLSMAAPQAGSDGQGSTAGAGAGAGSGAGSGGGGRPGPETCPGQPWRQPPCVCLSAPVAGSYPPIAGQWAIAGAGAGGGGGGGGAGVAGRPPTPCLSAPIDEDAGVENE
jgi:hypothetical protein